MYFVEKYPDSHIFTIHHQTRKYVLENQTHTYLLCTGYVVLIFVLEQRIVRRISVKVWVELTVKRTVDDCVVIGHNHDHRAQLYNNYTSITPPIAQSNYCWSLIHDIIVCCRPIIRPKQQAAKQNCGQCGLKILRATAYLK